MGMMPPDLSGADDPVTPTGLLIPGGGQVDDGLPARVDPADHADPVAALRDENRQLREAIETRDVIGQAKGIVMVGFRCDADTAFDVLCRLSQNTNRKVRDVAALVVQTVADDRPLPEDLQQRLLDQFRARPEPLG